MLLSGKTRVIGIFGQPIEHSMSPVIQNAAFKAAKLDYVYIPLQVHEHLLNQAVEGIRALNLVGVNVTIPHKEKVIPYLDNLSTEAKLIGAVNVIINDKGTLVGYNTDGRGFVESLRFEAKVEPKGKRIAILGAGGAARAVAIQLALDGAEEIYLLNRSPEKAKLITDVINSHTASKASSCPLENAGDILKKVDILINSTPIGMYPNQNQPALVERNLLSEHLLVCDLVYNPLETTLLRNAKEQGCQILKGTGMLIYQGALAFEIWTGQKASVEIMYEALLKNLRI